MNINSINFNSKHLVVTENLKTSLDQARVLVPYEVDTGSDGNIMPLHIYKKLFPWVKKKQPEAKKGEHIKLKAYNSATIMQMGRCKVKVEDKNRVKICSFFVVPGNGQALLGMPDIKTLDILTVNCNTIETKEADGAENHKTNTAKCQESTSEKQYINMRQEADTIEKCYTNTDSVSKFDNKDKPLVTDNDNYYT